MKDKYDVIIIGAGPAGLSCAIELQSSGKTVLVLEKNKEVGSKICAGGLTSKIKNLGFFSDIADILFSSIKINIPGAEKTVSNGNSFIGTIDRKNFGNMLLENLSEKIEVKTGLTVDKVNEDFIEVNGQKIKYKYLVGADGSNSMVRRFLGLKTDKFLVALQYIIPKKNKHLELFFDAFLFGSGYAWVFPHKDYTSIGCCSDVNFVRACDFKNNFEKWLSNQNIETKEFKLEGGIINFDYQGFEFGNKFLVGDAAGFASGLTGEGIFFGMVSGQEVAKKIINSAYECKEISRILRLKHTHERILSLMFFLMSINKLLLNFYFRLLFFFLNSKYFTKKVLKIYI